MNAFVAAYSDMYGNGRKPATEATLMIVPLRRSRISGRKRRMDLVTVTKSMRLFLPEMRERRSGTIINVASVAGFLPLPYISLYAATKAFMVSLGASVGREAQAYGVIVQTCCPGQTATDFHATAGLAEPRYALGGCQTADEVVTESLASLDHPREPLVTGLRNRLLVQLLR